MLVWREGAWRVCPAREVIQPSTCYILYLIDEHGNRAFPELTSTAHDEYVAGYFAAGREGRREEVHPGDYERFYVKKGTGQYISTLHLAINRDRKKILEIDKAKYCGSLEASVYSGLWEKQKSKILMTGRFYFLEYADSTSTSTQECGSSLDEDHPQQHQSTSHSLEAPDTTLGASSAVSTHYQAGAQDTVMLSAIPVSLTVCFRKKPLDPFSYNTPLFNYISTGQNIRVVRCLQEGRAFVEAAAKRQPYETIFVRRRKARIGPPHRTR